MTALRQRMIAAMQMHGFSARTSHLYADSSPEPPSTGWE